MTTDAVDFQISRTASSTATPRPTRTLTGHRTSPGSARARAIAFGFLEVIVGRCRRNYPAIMSG